MAEPTTRDVWELVALGTGGTGSALRRAYPSLLLKAAGERVLIDCGDGSLHRFLLHEGGGKTVDTVILTALTAERLGGLLALLDNQAVRNRHRRPDIVGPAGTARAIESFARYMARRRVVGDVIEVDAEHAMSFGGATLRLEAVDEGPSGCSLGLQIREAELPGRFDVNAARRLGVKPGPAFSRLVRGENVDGIEPHQVTGPPRPGRRLTILGPCRPTAPAAALASGALGLLVVAPYTEERQELAVEQGVMTGAEAAVLATSAGAEAVALLHLTSPTRTGYARREAAQFHKRVLIPADGDGLVLPCGDDAPLEHHLAAPQRPTPS